jgi:uncharacterized membrane protein YiaA
MEIVLLVIAFIVLIIGFFNLTNATLGVGICAIACFFAILARLAQASSHHKELKILLTPKEEVKY